jgi:hypothetical protein
MSESTRALKVIVFDPDMIFSSRIENAARKYGFGCQVVSNIADLADAVRHGMPADGLFINLDAFGQDFDKLRELTGQKSMMLGYYSHVRVELAEAAKKAGVSAVSRGAFVSGLEQVLRSLQTKLSS